MRLPGSLVSLALAVGLTAGSSCSLILDFPQCQQDLDCVNVQGVDLVCRSGECVAPTDPSTVACATDADCAAEFEENVVCGISGSCASLTTDRCSLRIRPEGPPESVVYLGSILPRTGTYEQTGAELENAVQLAVEDFNSTNVLPDGKRVAWVACDSQGRASVAAQAAQELAEAGVTAVVGPALSQEMIDVSAVTVGNGMLLVSPTASAAILGQLDDDGLVFSAIGNDAVQGVGLADRLAALDPVPGRIVALVKNDLYGTELLANLTPHLDFLPGDALGTLLYSPVDSFEDSDALRSEYGARVATAFDRDPDVIAILGSVEARELILFYLEAWAESDPRPALPLFMVSSEAVPVLESVVNGVSENFRTTLMEHLEGVSALTQDPDNYGPFVIRYEIRFPSAEAGLVVGLGYDAAMMAMLAMSAVPGGEGTGAELAEVLTRISESGATAVSMGQGLSWIPAAQQALAAGDAIDLEGISGALEIDPAKGTVRADLTGWDVVPSGTSPRLTAARRYELDTAPASTGTWVDL